MAALSPDKFHYFEKDISEFGLPEKFTFPFAYKAHPLAFTAAKQVQVYLENSFESYHNFGLIPGQSGLVIGKMFGVLVVQNQNGQIGFLAAYSGKLDQGEQLPYFVPPVFDVFEEGNFYRKEELNISALNEKIEAIENKQAFLSLQSKLAEYRKEYAREFEEKKEEIRQGRRRRKQKKLEALEYLTKEKAEEQIEANIKESLRQKYELRLLNETWSKKIKETENQIAPFLSKINTYKEERKRRSNQLQQELFRNYTFLNALKKERSLLQIFSEDLGIAPPAGAGECAAPKLLHHAYKNNMTPITMLEFWWGASPKSEIRKHKEIYPACNSKCGPILGFMLQGLAIDENPMMKNPAEGKELEVIFEDDSILIINKPADFLSVPGRFVKDSVQTRIRKKYPDAFLVHRLDQGTSGIILIAKNHESYVNLQRQFTRRTVSKQYVAVLNGLLSNKEGFIDLPLRVDLNNRPHQLVCYDHGKPAKTKYKVISEENRKTRIHFYPVTGRTHQLRVHAAHPDGLNTPIVGDDLYGKSAERLHLHAAYLEFDHPETRERISFSVKEEF